MVASAYIWQEVRRVRQSEILGGQYLAALCQCHRRPALHHAPAVQAGSKARGAALSNKQLESIDTGETLSRATGAYGTDKGARPASDWLAARTIDEDWDWMIPFRLDDTGDSRRPGRGMWCG